MTPRLRSSFLVLALAAAAHAQVGTVAPTSADSGDLTPQIVTADIWVNRKLPGEWRQVSATQDKRSYQCSTKGSIFGAAVSDIQAYFDGETLSKIEIVWLEAGSFFGWKASAAARYREDISRAEKDREIRALERDEKKESETKRREWDEVFAKTEHALTQAISEFAGDTGKVVSVGRSSSLRMRVREWVKDGLNLRLLAESDQLLSLTIRQEAAATRSLGGGGVTERRRGAQETVEELPNGDTILTGIPMFNQGGRGYCAIGTLAMVGQYYGLDVNIDQLAAKAGYKEGDTERANIIPIYQAAAQEGRLRFSQSSHFDFRNAMRTVSKGTPILVWRWFSRERDAFHTEFALRHAQDPDAILPNPRDRTDKTAWPTRETGGHASLITGFNKDRNEVIFTESWGENTRNRRMTGDEMEATAYAVFVFEP